MTEIVILPKYIIIADIKEELNFLSIICHYGIINYLFQKIIT